MSPPTGLMLDGVRERMPRVSLIARRVPPEWPHRRTPQERMLKVSILILLGLFVLTVVVSLIDWIALSNQ